MASPAPEIRVLLVEDDPEDAKRIREMLEASDEGNFRVEEAAEVEAALGLLQNGRFQVVLLDLTLPEGEGLEVLARAQVAAAAVPIIALATDADEAIALQALRLGAQDCLAKGRFEPGRLARVLRHAVERHRLLAEVQFARHREHYVATHDALTGLPNRIHMLENLNRMLAYADRTGKPIAVMFLDLDRFKTINDGMGHPAGDELLRQVAERLCPLIRRSDLMARLGGDEFVVLLQGVDREHAPARVAEKILERLAEPFVLPSGEHWIAGSIGIALYPRDGADADALVRNADTAMYQAKAAGGDAFRFYDESMNAAAARRLTLEHGLRRAIVTNELALHYQPRVDLRTGSIVSAEALLRWSSGDLGIVPPSEIIPVAEETGLIHSIGRWALAAACTQARSWEESGAPRLGVSVNVSAHELKSEALLRGVTSALWDSGLAPGRLELEITETALMRDERMAAEVLKELKRIGVRVSLDDFGTGFSSLALLKSTPVDALKIDRAFVRDVRTDSDDAAIVSAILAMAEQLSLGVVAEGVETEKQRDFLRARGCHEMQGYLFAKPLPPDDLLALLQGRKTPPTRK
jgi:diguanylate cyclase (GGDEF)-like protein